MNAGLIGVKVVVTRAAHQARDMVEQLTAVGAEAVELPVIALEEPRDGGRALRAAASNIQAYDWLVVTSVNTVGRLRSLITSPPRARIASIGSGTAEALVEMGLHVDLVPDEFVAEALVAAFPDGSGRVLLPRAEVARNVLPDGLRSKGWDVDVVTAYRTTQVTPSDEALEAALGSDVLTFTAPSTVRAFLEVTQGRPLPSSIVCIGPITAAAAVDAGLRVDAVATDHTIEGLVETIVRTR